jgi:hypothetical protein
VNSVDQAENMMRGLIPTLRAYDLVINEAKSVLLPATSLVTEEPDLEQLFDAAICEISDQLDENDFQTDYGFQSDWDDGELEQGDLELEATKLLFNSIDTYTGHEESIERFCLPLFAKASSDHAVTHVLQALSVRPSMTQIYCAYLVRFIERKDVQSSLFELLVEKSATDWQRMWIMAALNYVHKAPDTRVKIALDILSDTSSHDCLRAVAAMFVGKHGDHARRTSLRNLYVKQSPYTQLAIFYSSRKWPSAERTNARSNWVGHSTLHKLMASSIGAKGSAN